MRTFWNMAFFKKPRRIFMLFRKMLTMVFYQLQIGYVVIKGIPIFMMNTFFRFEFSAKMFFHNISMFFHPCIRRNFNRVIFGVSTNASFPHWNRFIKSISTSVRAKSLFSYFARKLFYNSLFAGKTEFYGPFNNKDSLEGAWVAFVRESKFLFNHTKNYIISDRAMSIIKKEE